MTLSGSGVDPDAGVLTYQWIQTSGTPVTFSDTNVSNPSFNTINNSETLTFQLTVNDDAGQIATDTVNVVVTANVSPGSIQFSSSTYSVNENGSNAIITATRTSGVSGAVSVTYSTTDGVATENTDYTSVSGTLTWADGDSADKTFNIPINNDTEQEENETLSVNLAGITGGASLGSSSATLTIIDDDTSIMLVETLSLSAASYSVDETVGTLNIEIIRTGSVGAASVDFSTTDTSAISGIDYNSNVGTLRWVDGGSESKTIVLDIIDNSLFEGDKTFNIELSNAVGASLVTDVAIITIIEDEIELAPEPIVENQPPAASILIAPGDGRVGVEPGFVEFEWNTVIDPEGDEVTYLLEYCINADFTECDGTQTAQLKLQSSSMIAGLGGGLGIGIAMFGLIGATTRRQQLTRAIVFIIASMIISACGTNIPYLTADGTMIQNATNLQSNTMYYWKVTATDSNGLSSTSEVWEFKTL